MTLRRFVILRRDDTRYAEAANMIVDFAFDEQVARVFPDMIRRSVPGYDAIITLLGLFAEHFAQNDSTIYDLGCSTAAASLAIGKRIRTNGCRLIAVDNSESMVIKAKQNLAVLDQLDTQVICADIQDIGIKQASLVVLNFTLQFIPPDKRLVLLQHIYNGLNPGGALVLSEKIHFTDSQEQAMQESLQLDYKRANGYSELEIAQKRSALENVLIPDDLAGHMDRLKEAGFSQVYQWFQSFNFVSLLAIK